MSEFTMKFSTSNAAFVEGQEYEVADIIRAVGDKVETGYTSGPLYDSNGNAVGSWDLELPKEPTPEPDEDDDVWNDVAYDEGEDGETPYRIVWSFAHKDWYAYSEVEWDEEKGDYLPR